MGVCSVFIKCAVEAVIPRLSVAANSTQYSPALAKECSTTVPLSVVSRQNSQSRETMIDSVQYAIKAEASKPYCVAALGVSGAYS